MTDRAAEPSAVGQTGLARLGLTHEVADRDYGRDTAQLPASPPVHLVGLEATNISAWFSGHKVLERVSLHMLPGKVTALIGPSGCGKSTFLRIMNRMHEMVPGAQLAGQVMLASQDIYDPAVRPADVRRRIGMVFQKPNPFPAMSIYDNVASGLKLSGTKVPDISGLVAVSADVLLLDEPCSALDPTSTNKIEETIAELPDQVTIVIVTHNMQQAQRVSDDCAFFLATHDTPGYIVESGPTTQIFGNPADPRTADYVHGRFG